MCVWFRGRDPSVNIRNNKCILYLKYHTRECEYTDGVLKNKDAVGIKHFSVY